MAKKTYSYACHNVKYVVMHSHSINVKFMKLYNYL